MQVGTVSFEAWLGAVAVGSFACAVLMVNNIRDAEQDRLAKKRTLAVMVGYWPSRVLFAIFAVLPFAILVYFEIFFGYAIYVNFALLAAAPAVLITLTARSASEFILALKLTSFAALLFGLGLGGALAF